jgi:uncharacterized protein YkwD
MVMNVTTSLSRWFHRPQQMILPLLERPSKAPARDKIMEALENRILFSISPTGAEQEMLEMINRMRENPTAELEQIFISTDPSHPNYFETTDAGVNAALDFFGVDASTLFAQFAALTDAPPLAWNEALMDSAFAHSNLMIQHDSQAHILPGEAGLLDRMVSAGYNWTGSVSVSENVFAYTDNVFHGHSAFAIDWGSTPTGIQNPAGHRDNIMDANLQEIGIAIVAENNASTSVGPFVVTQDFGVRGNYGDARVLGVIFQDGDGDAFYDAGEGIGGVTITISNGSTVFETTSMTAGGYQIAVAAGTYDVVASGGGLGSAHYMGSITVGMENVKVDLDTSNAPVAASVSGVVFSDLDQNGVPGGSEGGFGGFTVFVDADSDGLLDAGENSTVTNASGSYTLTGLSGGTYDIGVLARGGYLATTSESLSVSVGPGQASAGNDFGQFQWLTKSGNVATINGTGGNDSITFTVRADGTSVVGFNGKGQTLDATYTDVVVDGAAGTDWIVIYGDGGDDTVTIRPGTVYLTSSSHVLSGTGIESIRMHSGGGADVALLYDGASDDTFNAYATQASLIGTGFNSYVHDFAQVKAYATGGGNDEAFLYDDTTDDTFTGRPAHALLSGANFYNFASGFDSVKAYATAGGTDRALFYDDESDDRFVARPTFAYLSGTGFYNYASGFEQNKGYATSGGTDIAFLYDDTSDDTFVGKTDLAYLYGDSFYSFARGFGTVKAFATEGNDLAFLYDGANDDTFVGRSTYAYLTGSGYYNWAEGFDQAKAYATAGGTDLAFLYDDTADDTYTATPDSAYLWGSGFYNYTTGFDSVKGYATTGNDTAFLYDSAADDIFSARDDLAYLRGPNSEFFNYAHDFDRVNGFATQGGYDMAYLYDSSGDDIFTAYSGYAFLRADDSSFFNFVSSFDKVNAFGGTGGTDSAFLYDSAANDVFTAKSTFALMRDETSSYFNYVRDFANVHGYSTNGGSDTAFLYDSAGDDTLTARIGYASLSGSSFYNRANGFAKVNAYGTSGGTNTDDIAATIDFVLQQFGDWT